MFYKFCFLIDGRITFFLHYHHTHHPISPVLNCLFFAHLRKLSVDIAKKNIDMHVLCIGKVIFKKSHNLH